MFHVEHFYTNLYKFFKSTVKRDCRKVHSTIPLSPLYIGSVRYIKGLLRHKKDGREKHPSNLFHIPLDVLLFQIMTNSRVNAVMSKLSWDNINIITAIYISIPGLVCISFDFFCNLFTVFIHRGSVFFSRRFMV